MDDAVAEASALIRAGHNEIVLTGVFLGAYGRETAIRKRFKPGPGPLAELVDALASVEGLHRLRLSSLEPGDVDDALLDVLARHDACVPHLHLPLQSGSPTILRRMNRQYDVEAFLDMVDRVKARLDRPAITTDIIVGFPGETEEDFEATLDVAAYAGLCKIHAFPFSPREKTAAARWTAQFVPSDVVKDRMRRLADLEADLSLQFRRPFVGTPERVIVETISRHSQPEADATQPEAFDESSHSVMCKGRSDRYFTVSFEADHVSPGDVINVNLDAVDQRGWRGSLLPTAAGSAKIIFAGPRSPQATAVGAASTVRAGGRSFSLPVLARAVLIYLGWVGFLAFSGSGSSQVLADELYLEQYGVIEGRVAAELPYLLRVETVTGTLDVPVSIVARRVYGISRLQRYQAMKDALAQEQPEASRHVQIAKWCRDQALDLAYWEQVDAALALEPSNPEARRLAGYVLLGDLWLRVAVRGGSSRSSPARTAGAGMPQGGRGADARIVDQLVAGWYRSIGSIHDRFLSGPEHHAAARQQLFALHSPLTIPAGCRFLWRGGLSSRLLLSEFLGSFEQDVAALNLFAMALLDEHASVRLASVRQLARRSDMRAVNLFRSGLRCDIDEVVRRSANALGQLKDPVAAGDLILALPTDAHRGRRATLGAILEQARNIYATATTVPLTNSTYEIHPNIVLPDFDRTLESFIAGASPASGTHRSEVQQALIAVTGRNFGFNSEAWSEWLKRNPPLQAAQP